MEVWQWAVLLKFPALALLSVLYYWIVIRGLRSVYNSFPDSKVVHFLFRERGSSPPMYGTKIGPQAPEFRQ